VVCDRPRHTHSIVRPPRISCAVFVQSRFVDFSAQTKRKFARFDFLRIAELHIDGNGADDRLATPGLDLRKAEFGREPGNICSHRVFRILTLGGHRAAIQAVCARSSHPHQTCI